MYSWYLVMIEGCQKALGPSSMLVQMTDAFPMPVADTPVQCNAV